MRIFLFLVLALVTAAAILVPHDQELSHFARSTEIQHKEALAEWMDLFRVLGKGNILFLAALAVGSWGLKRRAREMIIALLLSAVLVWPIKLTVQRERPNGSNHQSFPSADAAAVAAASVPLVAWSLKLLPAAGVVVLSVSASRVFYGAHFPADVCAGMVLGVIAGVLAIRLNRKWHWSPGWRVFIYTGLIFYLAHILIGLFDLGGDLSGKLIFDFLKTFGLVILFLLTARFIRVLFRRSSGPTVVRIRQQ